LWGSPDFFRAGRPVVLWPRAGEARRAPRRSRRCHCPAPLTGPGGAACHGPAPLKGARWSRTCPQTPCPHFAELRTCVTAPRPRFAALRARAQPLGPAPRVSAPPLRGAPPQRFAALRARAQPLGPAPCVWAPPLRGAPPPTGRPPCESGRPVALAREAGRAGAGPGGPGGLGTRVGRPGYWVRRPRPASACSWPLPMLCPSARRGGTPGRHGPAGLVLLMVGVRLFGVRRRRRVWRRAQPTARTRPRVQARRVRVALSSVNRAS